MPAQRTDSTALGSAARRIGDRARSIVRHELELARQEIQRKLAEIGLGIGLAVGAVVLLLFALGFALAGAAAGLETVLPTWASLLVVAGSALLGAVALGLLAARALRRGTHDDPD